MLILKLIYLCQNIKTNSLDSTWGEIKFEKSKLKLLIEATTRYAITILSYIHFTLKLIHKLAINWSLYHTWLSRDLNYVNIFSLPPNPCIYISSLHCHSSFSMLITFTFWQKVIKSILKVPPSHSLKVINPLILKTLLPGVRSHCLSPYTIIQLFNS